MDSTIRIAPFWNVTFYVTGRFGEIRSDHVHVGLDIATPYSAGNPPLYSMVDGYIMNKGYSSARGYYVIIRSDDNIGFLYQHMHTECPLNVGDRVTPESIVGYEGSSGNVTGKHLHLEMQDLTGRTTWNSSGNLDDYLNPATFIGISNTINASGYYTPSSPSPIYPDFPKGKFKWVLYARKLRNR